MIASASSAALLISTAAMLVFFLTNGVYRASRTTGAANPRILACSVVGVFSLWLAATAALALSGVLSDWSARPPRWPLLPLTALLTFALLSITPLVRRLLAGVPPWQPIALQTFRIGVELAFWRLHEEGLAPVQLTFEGRNFDVLAGLTAPAVAFGVSKGWLGHRVIVGWNLLGLALLFNAIGTVATSAPGPLHLDWPGEPFAAIALWPVIWIPAFLAPAAIFLHGVSLSRSAANH